MDKWVPGEFRSGDVGELLQTPGTLTKSPTHGARPGLVGIRPEDFLQAVVAKAAQTPRVVQANLVALALALRQAVMTPNLFILVCVAG